MDVPQDKSADFRRQAAACLEVAKRMSLREDRERMAEMAQRWLDLARQAEAGGEEAQDSGQRQQIGNQPPPPSPEHGQQPALQQQQAQPEDDGDA